MRRMTPVIPARPNIYSGGTLDRAAALRTDEAWLAAARRDPDSRYVLFNAGRVLLAPDASHLAQMPPPADHPAAIFLGLLASVPIFAAEVEPDAAAGRFTELRNIAAALHADEANLAATGLGLLHWLSKHHFCTACGGANLPRRGGHMLQCQKCGTEHFPRSDPAVIMLVTRGGKLLLGQSHRFPKDVNWYSTLAGFVEPGESLEDAVRREVLEEVGVRVGAVTYHSSQPWPFPASLMVGYYAEGLTDEIVLEAAEMRDARWFTPDEIANRGVLGFELPPPESIARRLIDDWLAAAMP